MSKQGVAIQKTAVTVTPVTTYAGMSASVLDDFIKSQYAQCRSLSRKLERRKRSKFLDCFLLALSVCMICGEHGWQYLADS